MQYQLYQLHFTAPVHIGRGLLSGSATTFCADTLFSALCIQALKSGGETALQQLVTWAKQGKCQLTDTFPFTPSAYYLPKPMIKITHEQQGNSELKKKFKKLKYINIAHMDAYLQGRLDVPTANKELAHWAMTDMRTLATSRDEEKLQTGDMLPYSVEICSFSVGGGLYFIVGTEHEEVAHTIETLLYALRFSGLGGKRNVGMGRFEVFKTKVPKELLNKLGASSGLLLSTAMAKTEEMEQALQDAHYQLLKRSGFADSGFETASDGRKRDFYAFQSGSYFQNGFEGDVVDVSHKVQHPVYRYAKPFFMEVSQ